MTQHWVFISTQTISLHWSRETVCIYNKSSAIKVLRWRTGCIVWELNYVSGNWHSYQYVNYSVYLEKLIIMSKLWEQNFRRVGPRRQSCWERRVWIQSGTHNWKTQNQSGLTNHQLVVLIHVSYILELQYHNWLLSSSTNQWIPVDELVAWFTGTCHEM